MFWIKLNLRYNLERDQWSSKCLSFSILGDMPMPGKQNTTEKLTFINQALTAMPPDRNLKKILFESTIIILMNQIPRNVILAGGK